MGAHTLHQSNLHVPGSLRRFGTMLKDAAKRLGLHRVGLLYTLYHKYVCRDPHPLNMPRRAVVLRTDGQQIWVGDPTVSFIGRSIFYHGLWEAEATALVGREVRAGMTVLDIGAHTGYFTLLLAKRVTDQGRVIAFEPEAVGLDFLRRNIALNGHNNVTVVPLALSDSDGDADVTGKTVTRVQHASPNEAHEKPGYSNRVRAFDGLAAELGITRLDFIKIDVEGAEMHVLEGMRESLIRWSPKILLEIHPSQLAASGRSESALRAYLEDLGYVCEPVVSPAASGVHTVICRRSR